MKFWNLVVRTAGSRITEIWGGSEVWKRQSRKWWADTPWNNEEEGGSELCWGSDWVLTGADLLPEPPHAFWKMVKVIILYVGVKKPRKFPKGWRGQVV